MEEIWKIHPSFPQYRISNYGNIICRKGNLLKIICDWQGYHTRGMVNGNGEIKKMRVHRLVAQLFIPNPNPELHEIINHLDGNKLNNHYLNLEWTDHQGNVTHAIENNLRKWSPAQILEQKNVIKLRDEFDSSDLHINYFIEKYSLKKSSILSCLTYKTFISVNKSDKFKYKINYLKGDELEEFYKLRIYPKELDARIEIKKIVPEISQEYVDGESITKISQKYGYSFDLIKEFIASDNYSPIILKNEIFKNYSTDVKVSNLGRVIINNRITYIKTITDNGSNKSVVRIIAELFIPNPNNWKYVRIIDISKQITIDNIEWYTTKDIRTIDSVDESIKNKIIFEHMNLFSTRSEMCLKYDVNINTLDKILFPYSWFDTVKFKSYMEKYLTADYEERNLPEPTVDNPRCKICGINNPKIFFPGLPVKCIDCNKEQRILFKQGKTYVAPAICKPCGETDTSKFVVGSNSRCITCRKNINHENFLCKICGDINSEAFYQHTISTCKKCISDKRFIKLGKTKTDKQPHLCKGCGETDWTKFSVGRKGSCRSCSKSKIVESNSEYKESDNFACSVCNDKNPESFYVSNISKCKNCISDDRFNRLGSEKKKYNQPPSCKECGDGNVDSFYVGNKTICKGCTLSAAKIKYKNSKKNF